MKLLNSMIPVLVMFIGLSVLEQVEKNIAFADHWEFIGTAVEEEEYTIWGSSPITGCTYIKSNFSFLCL